MTHKEWFSDAVVNVQLPADPEASAHRRMAEIRTLLVDMVNAFNEVSGEKALGLAFSAKEQMHPTERTRVLSLGLQVQSPNLGPTPIRTLADVPMDPTVMVAKQNTAELAKFSIQGPDIRYKVNHEVIEGRLLGEADPAVLVKAAVDTFLQAEKYRRGGA